jgi:hypothetical protein
MGRRCFGSSLRISIDRLRERYVPVWGGVDQARPVHVDSRPRVTREADQGRLNPRARILW